MKKKSITFAEGFLGHRGDVGFQMVVDYERAKALIKNEIKAGKVIKRATLGLQGDWFENNTIIYDGKRHYKYDCHGDSQWAIPTLEIIYSDGSEKSMEMWIKADKLKIMR